jgi:hypothetical protein
VRQRISVPGGFDVRQQVAGNRHSAWLRRVAELSAASALHHLLPTVLLQHVDHLTNLHRGERRDGLYQRMEAGRCRLVRVSARQASSNTSDYGPPTSTPYVAIRTPGFWARVLSSS